MKDTTKQGRGRRLILGAVAGLLAVAASVALTASPASARPSKIAGSPAVATMSAGDTAVAARYCVTMSDTSSFSARCYSTETPTGRYRAVVTCSNRSVQFGAWEFFNSGNWSTARCPAPYVRISQRVEFA
jgi:hypothetical protein